MLVVDEKHHLLGIFTGRDALRCLAENANPGATPLRAVMTHNPCTMDTSRSAMDALYRAMIPARWSIGASTRKAASSSCYDSQAQPKACA